MIQIQNEIKLSLYLSQKLSKRLEILLHFKFLLLWQSDLISCLLNPLYTFQFLNCSHLTVYSLEKNTSSSKYGRRILILLSKLFEEHLPSQTGIFPQLASTAAYSKIQLRYVYESTSRKKYALSYQLPSWCQHH